MNSSLLATIHFFSVNLFILLYLTKSILLFSNSAFLEKFTRATRVVEMIVSALFLITGIWLLFILGAVKTLFIIKYILVFVSIPVSVIGFKRKKKLLALLGLVLVFGAYGMSEAAKKKPFIPAQVEVSGTADDAAKLGVKTYIANCAMCHGKDGKKSYRASKDLSVSILDQASMETIVREGFKGVEIKMPAFGGTLTDEEITAVSVYLQTLRNN